MDMFLIEPGNVPIGRPRSKWLDQIRSHNTLPPADLWRCAISGWVILGWRNVNSRL